MIQYRQIRKAMIEGLAAYLGSKVIELSNTGKIPPYPFVTYDFSDPNGDRIGFPAIVVEDNQIKHVETVEFTVSFQSCAVDKAGSIELALQIRDWFKVQGHRLLKDAVNVVVKEVGGIDNRDVQVGEEWERKNGLDVIFRTVNVISEQLEPIETVHVQGDDPVGH